MTRRRPPFVAEFPPPGATSRRVELAAVREALKRRRDAGLVLRHAGKLRRLEGDEGRGDDGD